MPESDPEPPKRRLREAAPIYQSTASTKAASQPRRIRDVLIAAGMVAAVAAGFTFMRAGGDAPSGEAISAPFTDLPVPALTLNSNRSGAASSGEVVSVSTAAEASTASSAAAYSVFEKRCAQCHAIKMEVDGLNVLKHEILTDPNLGYITPGDLDSSAVWQRIGIDRDMPPEGAAQPTADELNTVKQWIEEGAPPFPIEQPRDFVSEIETWKLVRLDLEKMPVEARRYVRYFSFVNLHNNSFATRHGKNNTNYADKNIRLSRAALSKLINSLSWMPDIVVPDAVDPQQLIFKIDLRQVGWFDRNVWQRIQTDYPYGINLTVNADPQVREVAERVYHMSGTQLPILRADWFIDSAARSPLYYDILDLPHDIPSLEHFLGVESESDFVHNRLQRAGFSESGVSQSNRLVDRHAMNDHGGYYWRSYDFGRSVDRGNLFKFPLGPHFASNPYNEFAFTADGGEMIFSLPNGLQAYYLADGKGKRIDSGPTEVVRDLKETSGTTAVVNAISCMACHHHGMIRFADTVRPSKSVPFGEVRLKVTELFPSIDDMTLILSRDEDHFLSSLDAACGSFLRTGGEDHRDIRQFTEEPIGAIARYYQKDLEIEEVAAELGYSNPSALAELIRTNSRLRELGLGPLADGAAIKRAAWASTSESLFHSLAIELEIGTRLK